MTQQTPRIRLADHVDISSVVETHMATFPGFFLTSLGPRFLRLFYGGLVDSPLGILIVAEVDAHAVGFVGGTINESEFFAWLKTSRRRQFVQEAALASLRNPSSMRRLWRARRREAEAASSTYDAVLLTIGVNPRGKRAGIGRALVEAFGRELAMRGGNGFCLTTDAHGNVGVNTFYLGLGMRHVRTYATAEGRIMNEYASPLPLKNEGVTGV